MMYSSMNTKTAQKKEKKMNLKGKTVNILGDSITEGVGVSEQSKRYADVFANLTGAKVNNYGISGTRFAKQTVPTETNPSFDQDFISRVEEMDENADAVVVFGGTNDFGHGDAPLGDMQSRDPYTFYGACHILMSSLMEKFCGKPVVFMTPLQRAYTNDNEALINSRGYAFKQYIDIIKEVAEYYAIPVLDMYKMSGITVHVQKVKEELTVDGLHPSDKGARVIAERLKGFMEAL